MFKRSNLLFSSKLGQSCWDTMGETLDRSLRLEPLFGQHQFWSWWKSNYFCIGHRTQDSCKLRHVFGVSFLINTLQRHQQILFPDSKSWQKLILIDFIIRGANMTNSWVLAAMLWLVATLASTASSTSSSSSSFMANNIDDVEFCQLRLYPVQVPGHVLVILG